MSTSGTYTFGPSSGDLVLAAFARCGIRRAEITTEHMADAYNEGNLMLSDWSTQPGPNWWATDLVTETLTASTATYSLDASTIQLIAVYISTSNGTSDTDRLIAPLSAYEYAALPNKTTEGQPTSFWFNRTITPQISLWPVPDDTQTYTLKIRRWRQLQDTTINNGTQPDIPWRFTDAYVAGLASRLATIYALDRADRLAVQAKMAFDRACTNDAENVPLYIIPAMSTYYT